MYKSLSCSILVLLILGSNFSLAEEIISAKIDSKEQILELNIIGNRGSDAFGLAGGCLDVELPRICVFTIRPFVVKDYPDRQTFNVQINLNKMSGPSREAFRSREISDTGFMFVDSAARTKINPYYQNKFEKEKTLFDLLDDIYGKSRAIKPQTQIVIFGHKGTKFEFSVER